MSIGFIGLGRMGEPMALNLVRAGVRLRVWNRSRRAVERLAAAGAQVEPSARSVLRACPATILMLANDGASDAVLERGSPAFALNVEGRLIIQMGTTSLDYSLGLQAAVTDAGGRYVEAPVSGSRGPAEAGTLVAMLAGEPSAVEQARPLLAPMCRSLFDCGDVPGALATKLSVNLFLIAMVAGLAEAVHFAGAHGVDPALLQAVLDAGPMASPVSRMKLDKLVRGDLGAQASIDDVAMNNRLIVEAARRAGVATPLIDECLRTLEASQALGLGDIDMIGLLRGLEARTARTAGQSATASGGASNAVGDPIAPAPTIRAMET